MVNLRISSALGLLSARETMKALQLYGQGFIDELDMLHASQIE